MAAEMKRGGPDWASGPPRSFAYYWCGTKCSAVQALSSRVAL